MAEFRVRARAVDMLGRQQIAGIPTAIHELFKNAYDAYAENVEVDYFRGERLFGSAGRWAWYDSRGYREQVADTGNGKSARCQ